MLSPLTPNLAVSSVFDILPKIQLLRRLGLVYEIATRFRQLQDVLLLVLGMLYVSGSNQMFIICMFVFLISSGVSRVILAIAEISWLLYKLHSLVIAIPLLPGLILDKILEFTSEELYPIEKQRTPQDSPGMRQRSAAQARQQIIIDLEDVLQRLVTALPYGAEGEIITVLIRVRFQLSTVIPIYNVRCRPYDRAGNFRLQDIEYYCVERPIQPHLCYQNMYVSRGSLRLLGREVRDCIICHEPMKDGDLVTFHGTCGQSLHAHCAQDWHFRGAETCPFDNERLEKTP